MNVIVAVSVLGITASAVVQNGDAEFQDSPTKVPSDAVTIVSAQRFGVEVDVDLNKITPDLLEAFEENEEVKVIINVRNEDGTYPKNDKVPVNEIRGLIAEDKIEDYSYGAILATLSSYEVNELIKNTKVHSIAKFIPIKLHLQDVIPLIGADIAWNTEFNGEFLDGGGQSICILDTGIDFTHPDLAPKNIVGANVNCLASVFDPCIIDPSVTDTNGHGTHVAGIAAANGGINGVAKGANLIGIKVFDEFEVTTPLIVRRAIEWCIANKDVYNISVISMSFGATGPLGNQSCDGAAPFLDMQDGIEDAVLNHNISAVASTGNDGNSNGVDIPGCYSTVIPVAATDKDDNVAFFSNYGTIVKLFAPGLNINTTSLNHPSGYGYFSGTSASAPMVAASIAMINQFTELNGNGSRFLDPKNEIEPLLFEHADPIVDLDFSQWRRLHIGNVITSLVPSQCLWDLDGDGQVGIVDFLDLLSAWGPNPGHPADIDGDGEVGIVDFLLLLGNWGPCQ